VVESQQATTRLAECIERLDRWMGQNGLKLNAEKTQLIWLGSRHPLAKLTVSQLPLATTTSSSTVDIVSTANDLGVIWDGQLTMAIYILSVVQVFFQLRQLRSVHRSLTTETTRALVHFAVVDSTTATLFWPGSLMFFFSDSITLCRTRQPAWSPGLDDTTTSCRFLLTYTGI